VRQGQCLYDDPKEARFVDWITGSVFEEVPHPGKALQVNGTIPNYVNGVYIKNGPGAFSTPDGSRRYLHSFDGFAKLQKFEINGIDNAVSFTNRFIDTAAKRSCFETNRIPAHISVGPVEPKFNVLSALLNAFSFDNTPVDFEELSNTGTYVAVVDAVVQVQIDPSTLETTKIYQAGAIEGVSGITFISATHSKVAPRDGLTYNYILEQDLIFGNNFAHIVRTNKDLTKSSIGKVPQGRNHQYIHEISVTDNYAILAMGPIFSDLIKTLFDGSAFSAMSFDDSLFTEVYLFDLNEEKPVEKFEAPPLFAYHHANSYEDKDGKVVLDLIAYETADVVTGEHGFLYLENMQKESGRLQQEREGAVWRFKMDLSSGAPRFVEPQKKIVTWPETNLPLSLELVSIPPDLQGKEYTKVYGETGFTKENLATWIGP